MPGSKLPILGNNLIPPLVGNPYIKHGYIDPYYWADDHPYIGKSSAFLFQVDDFYHWLDFFLGVDSPIQP